MAEAQVTLTFVVNTGNVQDFIETMTDAAESFADNRRCPSVDKYQDMRCELGSGHEESRHHNGRLSWPVETTIVADSKVGHFACPSPGPHGNCEKSAHHHWRSPGGRDIISPGLVSGCNRDHLAEWEMPDNTP